MKVTQKAKLRERTFKRVKSSLAIVVCIAAFSLVFLQFAGEDFLALLREVAQLSLGNKADVRVINRSGDVVTSGEIELCGDRATFPSIQQNGEVTLTLKVSRDCHYDVKAVFASGKQVASSVGYVTLGTDFKDDILILSDRAELAPRKTE